MSGHSKFANIKHKKEKNDAAKGKVFTRIGREIAVAVKEGGADPANNSKLRDVVAKAKANNMPNDTIDRSIKKAPAGRGPCNGCVLGVHGKRPARPPHEQGNHVQDRGHLCPFSGGHAHDRLGVRAHHRGDVLVL